MNKRAQSVTEYALIIAVVAAALLTMQTYFKRGVQSIAKISADQLGGFDSGISADEVQQMAKDQERDPKYGALISYHVETSTDQSLTTTTQSNGERSLTINKLTEHVQDAQVPGRKFYQEY
jgi:Flp pilus assembly pilin Flp